MKVTVSLLLIGLMAAPALAQRHKIDINTETEEGQLLQQIGVEEDPAKKLGLLEQFAAKYPQHPGLPWVYGQMQPLYLKNNDHDKVFPVVEKLLAFDPTDVEMAHGALKAAEAKKDAGLIIQWATATSEAARKAVASKQPEDEDEVETWKYKVEFAKQVETYTEYSLFSAALQTPDPATKIKLIDALAERNPKSQYMPQLEEQQFLAYRQLNQPDKAMEIAERILATNPNSEDVLLFAADYSLNVKKDNAKAFEYAEKVVDLMKTKAAPQGVSAEDWEKKKTVSIGVGLWMQGMIHFSQNKLSPTDTTLREALPFLSGNDDLLASALFHLGLVNFRLGDIAKKPDTQRILDALRFNQQCAAIKSRYQSAAQRNINAIRSQYRIQ